MERLLNDIGAAGRLDGELEQEICANFDMCQLLRNIAQQYDPVAAEKNITSKFSTGEESDILGARLLVGVPRVCCSSSNHIGIT